MKLSKLWLEAFHAAAVPSLSLRCGRTRVHCTKVAEMSHFHVAMHNVLGLNRSPLNCPGLNDLTGAGADGQVGETLSDRPSATHAGMEVRDRAISCDDAVSRRPTALKSAGSMPTLSGLTGTDAGQWLRRAVRLASPVSLVWG